MTDLALSEVWESLGSGFEVQDGLLNVRSEVGEVEDLRDSGSGDAGSAGDLARRTLDNSESESTEN